MAETPLDLDSRGRVSLGSSFDESVTHLIARQFDDGSAVLEPASVARAPHECEIGRLLGAAAPDQEDPHPDEQGSRER